MKALYNIVLILASLFFAACSNQSTECDKIKKANLDGEWTVTEGSANGKTLEISNNTTFNFDRDGAYTDNQYEGTWEFGEFNNELEVYVNFEHAFNLNITEFSKTDMVMERIISGTRTEYHLSKTK